MRRVPVPRVGDAERCDAGQLDRLSAVAFEGVAY